MSDYLDRLITRSFGLSPVVGPRLPSIFEPSRAADGLQTEQPHGVEPSHTTLLVETSDAAPTRQAQPPRPRERTTAETPEAPPRGTDEGSAQLMPGRGRAAVPRSEPHEAYEVAPPETEDRADAKSSQSQHTTTKASETITLRPTPHVASEAPGDYVTRLLTPPHDAADETGRTADGLAPREPTLPPSPRTLSAAQPEASAASDEATSGQLSELEQQVEGLRRQIEELQSRRAPSEQRTETRAVVRETIVERGAQAPLATGAHAPLAPRTARRARAEVPKAVVFEPRIARYAGPKAEAQAQSDAPAQEPTINVTIGRIEVRAAPQSDAQSQPERRSHAPQAMNLQEYLRRRSGGHS
ncbi:MAG TPA: hypothetical protein VEX60_05910 [Pyrinomonadaceae bacterium]|nr:hypothetical protein [Pyrinomonadaceae bacterium]